MKKIPRPKTAAPKAATPPAPVPQPEPAPPPVQETAASVVPPTPTRGFTRLALADWQALSA